jgi:hypothetical protein
MGLTSYSSAPGSHNSSNTEFNLALDGSGSFGRSGSYANENEITFSDFIFPSSSFHSTAVIHNVSFRSAFDNATAGDAYFGSTVSGSGGETTNTTFLQSPGDEGFSNVTMGATEVASVTVDNLDLLSARVSSSVQSANAKSLFGDGVNTGHLIGGFFAVYQTPYMTIQVDEDIYFLSSSVSNVTEGNDVIINLGGEPYEGSGRATPQAHISFSISGIDSDDIDSVTPELGTNTTFNTSTMDGFFDMESNSFPESASIRFTLAQNVDVGAETLTLTLDNGSASIAIPITDDDITPPVQAEQVAKLVFAAGSMSISSGRLDC